MKHDVCTMIRNRWAGAERPLFKGCLIDDDGCCCAQGDVLRVLDCMADGDLLRMEQSKADKRVSELLGISLAHAVLLRVVNDSKDGCPQDVLDVDGGGIEKVLGPHAKLVLAFWRRLDAMTIKDWAAAWAAARNSARNSAGNVARDAAWAAAGNVARDAAWDAAWAATRAASWDATRAAAWATAEIQGISKLNGDPYFTKIFGIPDLAAWTKEIESAK